MDVRDDIDRIAGLLPGSVRSGHITVEPPPDGAAAASAFDVDRLLVTTASHAAAAADEAGSALAARTIRRRTIDTAHVAAFSTTHVEIDGDSVPAWADLSGLYRTVDGRSIQLHCNFPHHAEGVVARLGCGPEREDVAAAIARRGAFELEETLIDDGMIAAVVRTLDEWDAHPHAAATRELPLVSVERIGDASPIEATADERRRDVDREADDLPLDGLRVLDCSRVLAGPVAGHLLAGFGADVLRVGADHLPSVPVGVMSTGFGKRNASVDLRDTAGRDRFAGLLGGADVWIDAFRPGAFAGRGFSAERAAELRPGIVVVQICAFDTVGPWAGRRGFDSIVQSTTGVRWAGGEFGRGADGPVGLPVQALDYATGFLAAGVAAQLVAHQRREGGSWLGRVSLLRTRNHLVALGGPSPFTPEPVGVDPRLLHTVDSDFGRLTTVRPFVGEIVGAPRRLGSSAPSWLDDRSSVQLTNGPGVEPGGA